VHDTKSTYSSSVSFSPNKFFLFILLGLFWNINIIFF
jgi:hypothetical protein